MTGPNVELFPKWYFVPVGGRLAVPGTQVEERWDRSDKPALSLSSSQWWLYMIVIIMMIIIILMMSDDDYNYDNKGEEFGKYLF